TSGVEWEQDFSQLVALQRGQVVRDRFFYSWEQGLQAAGLEPKDWTSVSTSWSASSSGASSIWKCPPGISIASTPRTFHATWRSHSGSKNSSLVAYTSAAGMSGWRVSGYAPGALTPGWRAAATDAASSRGSRPYIAATAASGSQT